MTAIAERGREPLPFSPRQLEIARRWMMAVLLAVPLTYATWQSAWSAGAVEAPGFISLQQLDVGAASGGRVEQVFVTPLQDVVAGEPLVRLRDDRLDARALGLHEALRQAVAEDARTHSPHSIRTETLRADVAAIEQRIQSLTVVAPQPGRVVAVEVIAGDVLAPGRRVVRLAPSAGDTHVDAWVPRRHAGRTEPGTQAMVLFADGTVRTARVAAVPEAGHGMPAVLTGSYGRRQPGSMVRLDFIETGVPAAAPRAGDGTRVKVRFSEASGSTWAARVQDWFSSATERGNTNQGSG